MENQSVIKLYKTRLQAWLHASQAMVDFSKMSLRGAMLLNGAGIIPIVYSKVDYLYNSALLFGVGAFMAACATGTTYLAQWAIFTAWKHQKIHYPFRTSALAPEEEQEEREAQFAHRCVFPLRLVAMAFVLASLGCFAWGLYEAHETISVGVPAPQELSHIARPVHNDLPPVCCFPEP